LETVEFAELLAVIDVGEWLGWNSDAEEAAEGTPSLRNVEHELLTFWVWAPTAGLCAS
jgi:hypothetical protein